MTEHQATVKRDGSGRLFLPAMVSVVAVAGGMSIAEVVEPWDAANGAWQVLLGLALVWRLQVTQDRDTAAIQAKLDEIVIAEPGARNEVAGIEARK